MGALLGRGANVTDEPVSYARYIAVADCRNTVQVTHCPFMPPTSARAVRVNEWFYYVPSTEEFRPYRERSVFKGDNLDSVRKSFNRLKMLINCNFDQPDQVRYVTLTYAANMTDNARIREDMQKFVRNMKRRFGPFEYIYVKERQARGAWHMHCVLFFPDPAPFMSNTDDDHPVRDAWGHGFVNVQGFSNDINNLGNYLCAYLTDDRAASKKGGRLANYESGIRLYNCSRGVRRPVKSHMLWMDYEEFRNDEGVTPLSDTTRLIVTADGKSRTVRRELFAVI